MKNVNTYIKNILVLIGLFSVALFSCEKEDELETGTPVITNVRVVEKDSSITAGEFGLPVAIQGQNLKGVQKVLFNDLEAVLNPVYVSSTNILVYIPDNAPNELTNKITVITGSGESASFDFNVLLPKPVITQVYNEFAKAGSETVVLGNYFYFIEKVMIGEQEAEILAQSPTSLHIRLPEELGTDYLTVVGAAGTATSSFRLHETEGNMINFDIPATSWGSDVCWGDAERIDPENSEIEPVSGRYTRIKQTGLAPSGYQGDWVVSTCWFDFGLAPASHAEKVFRFEANIVEPWKAGRYAFTITLEDGKVYRYLWKPWDTNEYKSSGITTNGWRTFFIPLTDFVRYENDVPVDPAESIADISKIRDLNIAFANPGDDAKEIPSHYVALDNFRIVDR